MRHKHMPEANAGSNLMGAGSLCKKGAVWNSSAASLTYVIEVLGQSQAFTSVKGSSEEGAADQRWLA